MLKKHNFYDSDWNKSGDFKNDFKDNGNGTVSDRKTGLMWQQSGSDNYMKYKDISDVLGTSVGALKASYHQAVKKIEKQILLD